MNSPSGAHTQLSLVFPFSTVNPLIPPSPVGSGDVFIRLVYGPSPVQARYSSEEGACGLFGPRSVWTGLGTNKNKSSKEGIEMVIANYVGFRMSGWTVLRRDSIPEVHTSTCETECGMIVRTFPVVLMLQGTVWFADDFLSEIGGK